MVVHEVNFDSLGASTAPANLIAPLCGDRFLNIAPSTARQPTPVPRGGTAAPDRIALDGRLLASARDLGPPAEQALRELDACVDWHRANGRRRINWQATARNWLREAGQLDGSHTLTVPGFGAALPRPSDPGAGSC